MVLFTLRLEAAKQTTNQATKQRRRLGATGLQQSKTTAKQDAGWGQPAYSFTRETEDHAARCKRSCGFGKN
jgi:hypothetical protein